MRNLFFAIFAFAQLTSLTSAGEEYPRSIRTFEEWKSFTRFHVEGISKLQDLEVEDAFKTLVPGSNKIKAPEVGELLLFRMYARRDIYYAWTTEGLWRVDLAGDLVRTHDTPFRKAEARLNPVFDSATLIKQGMIEDIPVRIDLIRMKSEPEVYQGYLRDLKSESEILNVLHPIRLFEAYEDKMPERIEIYRHLANAKRLEYLQSMNGIVEGFGFASTIVFTLFHSIYIHEHFHSPMTTVVHSIADVMSLGVGSAVGFAMMAKRTPWLARRSVFNRKAALAAATLTGAACAIGFRLLTSP